jgi:peptidoglycan/xylan/chitin deacetylase (PgdA/CDA1 family)
MIGTLEKQLRRRWHHARRRMGAGASKPNRLIVSKAPWLDDARSPVTLMIDDLTNAFHGTGVAGWDNGGDWGGGLDQPNSAVRFLEERLLDDYPEARVTFFTVAGPISAYTHDQPFRHSAPLDADADSRRFFARLAADPRYELAYHGYDHGTAGVSTDRFVQEWRGFPSRAAAAEQTRKGLDIFDRAIGRVPRGGKYGGWDYNQYADDAVDDCGFLWWCRDWMPRDILGRVADDYYEPQFFGQNLVVAIPSTVHGHFWDSRQVSILLQRRQVIGIEEHIAPVRPDGLVQTPNIVDDIDELRRLYAYLRGQHVWHATCTEIASYVHARERSLIYDVTRDGFSIRYDGRVERPLLTLRLDGAAICSQEQPAVDVIGPDGAPLDAGAFKLDARQFRHRVTIPVIPGRYHVRPRSL